MKKLSLILLLFYIAACNNGTNHIHETITVDFSNKEGDRSESDVDSSKSLNVAVAAMISPKETYIFYEELFDYLSDKTGSKITMAQRKTYEEVNNMLGNQEVDVAFICSGAYVQGKEKNNLELLVVPVSDGKKYYQAYIVVHEFSGIAKIEDLKNKRFAYTDPLSHSGKLYVDKRLRDMGESSDFFSKVIYSNAHDISMQLVAKRIVDGASIKGNVYDYLAKFSPDRVKNLKIIEKSEPYGMPPVVVPADLDEQKKSYLRDLFLNLHEDPNGKKILERLLIDRFVLGEDAEYDGIRSITIFHP